jgi:hypothetical protein
MERSISFIIRIAVWVLPMIVAACASLSAQTFSGDFDRVLAPGGPGAQIGPYSGVTYSLHNGRFVTTERNVVCCEFNEGKGFGPAVGVRMNVSIDETFFIAPSIGYESRGGTFTSAPETLPFFGRNNQVETLTMESELEVSLATLNAEVLAGYRIGTSGLYAVAGPAASVVLAQHYHKRERIADPSGVRYLDGGTDKDLYDGDLDLVRPALFALRGGVGAVIPVADGISVTPQLLYSLPLGTASRSDDWTLAGLHSTVGVLFEL